MGSGAHGISDGGCLHAFAARFRVAQLSDALYARQLRVLPGRDIPILLGFAVSTRLGGHPISQPVVLASKTKRIRVRTHAEHSPRAGACHVWSFRPSSVKHGEFADRSLSSFASIGDSRGDRTGDSSDQRHNLPVL